MLKVGATKRVMVVVPVQFVVESGALFTLFMTVELSRTTTCGCAENVNTLFAPSMVPVGTRTAKLPEPPAATLAVPAPPLETVAPVVKLMVVTFTTGVMPSVTVSELPEPPPLPAPVISISLCPRHAF